MRDVRSATELAAKKLAASMWRHCRRSISKPTFNNLLTLSLVETAPFVRSTSFKTSFSSEKLFVVLVAVGIVGSVIEFVVFILLDALSTEIVVITARKMATNMPYERKAKANRLNDLRLKLNGLAIQQAPFAQHAFRVSIDPLY
jgi:hypothetical protein